MHGNSNPGDESRLREDEAGGPKSVQEARQLRVFNKICALSNTLNEIESWLDAKSSESEALRVPGGFLTLENLDARILAESPSVDLRPAH